MKAELLRFYPDVHADCVHVVGTPQFDPYADKEWAARAGIPLMSFEELLQTADVVSLHVTTTPETTNMINRQTLALMKPDAILVNTGRGALVDEDALCEALDRGHLFGAALDVFKTEPLPVASTCRQQPVHQAKRIGG